MAIRRLNYTGRKKLNRENVKIFLNETDSGFEFDANIQLDNQKLPDDAVVSVEAYRQTSWMRFPFGIVSKIVRPENRLLGEFNSPDGILFRVRVTSMGDPEGLLIAVADRIRPSSPEITEKKVISLLPVKPDDSMGKELYRIDFSDNPLLLINSKVGDWRNVARSPVFISVAFPSALREILTRILFIDKYYETEADSNWRSQWLFFAKTLPGITDPPSEKEDEHIDDWINEAVSAFCRKFDIMNAFERYWIEEGTQ